MKKLIRIISILFIIITTFAETGRINLAVYSGLYLPLGDDSEIYSVAPLFGGRFLYKYSEKIDLAGNLMLTYPGTSDDKVDDFSGSIISLNANIRYKDPVRKIYYGGGLGIYKKSWKITIDIPDDEPFMKSKSSAELGLMGVVGKSYKMKDFSLEPEIKLHLIGDTFGITAEVGISFPIDIDE